MLRFDFLAIFSFVPNLALPKITCSMMCIAIKIFFRNRNRDRDNPCMDKPKNNGSFHEFFH